MMFEISIFLNHLFGVRASLWRVFVAFVFIEMKLLENCFISTIYVKSNIQLFLLYSFRLLDVCVWFTYCFLLHMLRSIRAVRYYQANRSVFVSCLTKSFFILFHCRRRRRCRHRFAYYFVQSNVSVHLTNGKKFDRGKNKIVQIKLISNALLFSCSEESLACDYMSLLIGNEPIKLGVWVNLIWNCICRIAHSLQVDATVMEVTAFAFA